MEPIIKIETTEKEIIIREGKATTIYDPEISMLSGVISTPGDFVEKRKLTFEALEAHVVADYSGKTIVLTINEDSKFKRTVTGSLLDFPELKDLQVNGKKTYTHRELLDVIKFKGAYFKSKDKHTELIGQLKKFEAKIEQEFQNANDYKGAQATRKVVDIKTNLGLEFELAIPIFTGGPPLTFMVDICVDINNGGCIFWLESVSLHDIQTKVMEEEFTKQLARLTDYAIVKKW